VYQYNVINVHLVTYYNPDFFVRVLNNSVPDQARPQHIAVSVSDYHAANIDFRQRYANVKDKDVVVIHWCLAQLDLADVDVLTGDLDFRDYFSKRIAIVCDVIAYICTNNAHVILNPISPSFLDLDQIAIKSTNQRAGRGLAELATAAILENLSHIRNLFAFSSRQEKLDLKSYYYLDSPYSQREVEVQCMRLRNFVSILYSAPIKVVIVDLDNTLWGGILGEIGSGSLNLGGLDAKGRIYRDIQVVLKRLRSRGILLAICSRNSQDTALDAIDNHPEMILRSNDFSSAKINWGRKSNSIQEIAVELGLSTNTFAFLDDNAREREEVRSMLPDVFVPEYSGEPAELLALLLGNPRFQRLSWSSEDLSRAHSYMQSSKRSLAVQSVSPQEQISPAKILEVMLIPVNVQLNAERCAQLLNKTNQFNSIGRRYFEVEFSEKVSSSPDDCYAFRAVDRFGDYGIICVVMASNVDDIIYIEDFVISCRALGRGVEHAVLKYIFEQSKSKFCRVSFVELSRNAPIRIFYQELGLLSSNLALITRPVHALLVNLEGPAAGLHPA